MSDQNDEVKNWYSDRETIESIQTMGEEEMNALLLQLSRDRTWIAILRYFQIRFQMLQRGLLTIDPVKLPTELARIQGYLNGLTDLPDAISVLLKDTTEIVEDDK